MWFDPDELLKGAQPSPATSATFATFPSKVVADAPKVAEVAEVATGGEPEPPTFAQKIELTWLVSTIHSAQGDPEKVIAECVQDALARPEAALECYRALWARRESRGAKHGD